MALALDPVLPVLLRPDGAVRIRLGPPPSRPSPPWWAWSYGRARWREAAVLWELLTAAAGVDARDAVWNHPDLLPSSADLDEPAAFIDRVIGGDVSSMDVDSLIAEIEKETGGPEAPGSPH